MSSKSIHLKVHTAKRYKPGRFNHFHTLLTGLTGENLAYNSLSNGLAVLDEEGWARYIALVKGAYPQLNHPVDRGLLIAVFKTFKNTSKLKCLKIKVRPAAWRLGEYKR